MIWKEKEKVTTIVCRCSFIKYSLWGGVLTCITNIRLEQQQQKCWSVNKLYLYFMKSGVAMCMKTGGETLTETFSSKRSNSLGGAWRIISSGGDCSRFLSEFMIFSI